MPQVRKLSPEEVQALQNKGKGQRKLTEELYDAILREYAVGDYGEAILDAGDNRLTVRNRLKAAAKRRNLGIDFRRTTGNLLRFQVVEHTNSNGYPSVAVGDKALAAVSSDVPPTPTKRKGGRPRKQMA